MIQLENVMKQFTTAKGRITAVDSVNLKIHKGEIFGIIGFSGAGKSTLVRCMNLLERPDSGQVIVNGQDLTKLREGELRKARTGIGMIFQQFGLFYSYTVAENVAFPLKKLKLTKEEKKAKVEELLRLVGLSEKALVYPSQLSGGQKQRVAIARALATNPNVLLCDEATSALDPQTTHDILKLLKKLNETLGITIVMITHEMSVIKEICQRVAVMEHGRVVEEGDVLTVFQDPKSSVMSSFIRSTSLLSKVYQLIEENSPIVKVTHNEKILMLTYRKMQICDPLISYISRTYEVNLNIIVASVEIIQESPLGGTVVILQGEPQQMNQAIKAMKEKGIGVEVIKDGNMA